MDKIIKIPAFINNKSYENGSWVNIISPATNEVIGQVPGLKKQEIDHAYELAVQAQKKWKELPLLKRIEFLDKWKKIIQENVEYLSDLMVLEIAKGKKAAVSEIMRSIEYIDYSFEEAKRLHPNAFSGESWGNGNKLGIFEYVPKGVVLAISPFNYPVNLAIAKIFPALITGNAVVFKPATQGSLVGLAFANLAAKAGLTAGVFNAVSGKGSDIGDSLVDNENINVISFTGSANVGNHIASTAHKVDLVLELGGKDPALVLKDADLQDSAKKIVAGAFSYSGQRCTAIKRVIVEESVKNELVSLIAENIKKLKVGQPEDNADITPVIDSKTIKFIKGLVDDALQKGAKLVLGNKYENNLMYPTLIDEVTEDMLLAWEEPFGPVLPVISFQEIDKAIALINKSNYALQAAIFTKDIDYAFSLSKKIEVGTVNINSQTQRGPDHFPFLGIKDSGLGIQGISDSIKSFTRPKGTVFNWKEK